jgi:hypothetical protein
VKTRWILAAAGLVGGVALAAVLLAREPSYRGVGVSGWLEDFDSSSVELQERAGDAMRSMGAKAVPALVGHLRAEDSAFKVRLISWARGQSRVRIRASLASERRFQAVRAIRALGAVARPAIPVLIELLGRDEIRNEVERTLVTIDPEIFPLSAAVRNSANEPAVRCAAARRLASSQYDPGVVRPVLVEALGSDCPGLPVASAQALARMQR